ncbi:MAG TPA: (Fe-S)-binding protein [Chloroflexota bacterium]|nr:(Fe-S)-binding protein [Chloroflexota bacterium]
MQETHGAAVAESPGLQGFLNEADYEALVKCVHCGLCLNQCPTYRANGLEPDSPRGRLYLIRAVSEGTLPVTDDVVDHLQLCLVCRACETACPSNVQFGQVMEAARHELLRHHSSRMRRFISWLAFRQLFPHPARLKLIGQALRLYQRSPLPRLLGWAESRHLIPAPLRRLTLMEQMAPQLSDRFFEPRTERIPAVGPRRYRVGMIAGCIMPLAFAPTDEATVRVLTANGCDVVIPKAQRCCGALAAHSGDGDASADLARANIDAFEAAGLDALDSIIINAAGCGAQLKNYAHMLRDDPRYAARAERFTQKVEDVSEFLARVGLTAPLGEVRRTVTYQDACHLVHGQKIRSQPRELLLSIPGLELVEMRDPDRCCGSAGIYNIVQPEMSMEVLEAKMENVLATGAEWVVAGNPGCLLQLNLGLKQRGRPPRAVHLVDLLDESIRQGAPTSPSPLASRIGAEGGYSQ